MTDIDPHAGEAIATAGAPPQAAEAAVILLHGRGDSPAGILRLVDELYHRGVCYIAPAAAGRVWYPGSFADPVTDRRVAYLDSALGQVEAAVDVARELDITVDETVIAGFSQGAAVGLEYVTRNPNRYGGVAALAGGLLGPSVDFEPRAGTLAETPVFCGVGADDPMISVSHVGASGELLREMGAETSVETYPDLGHEIGDGEIDALNRLIDGVSPN